MRLLVLLAAAACVPPVSVTGAPCPCPDGWRCCEGRCVAAGTICAGDTCPLPPVDAPSLAVGGGTAADERFLPLDDDPRVDLHPGFQFGYHVYIQIRGLGLDPDRVTIVSRLLLPAGDVEARSQTNMTPLLCPSGEGAWGLAQGLVLFVCPSFVPDEPMNGRDLRLEVTVSDDTLSLDAAATIRPVCPDDGVCETTTPPGCAAPSAP